MLTNHFAQTLGIDCDDSEMMYPIVTVTHCQNPSLFYCRFESDKKRFLQLAGLIQQQIEDFPNSMPGLKNDLKESVSLLCFSIIQKQWCRGRLIAIKFDPKSKTTCAKILVQLNLSFGNHQVFVIRMMKSITSTVEKVSAFHVLYIMLNRLMNKINRIQIGQAMRIICLRKKPIKIVSV
ncbi:uncharacterized protein NH340_JMT06259 [Sarcoptes scabiei]|nr:uncharacterized protein NH340_JMT06259 [Sarcoptes scabiei]